MLPIICLTNGRPDCISKTVPSVIGHLTGVTRMVFVDDSGDDVYRGWLSDQYSAEVIPVGADRRGYWQAMRTVWDLARSMTTDAIVFWEEDFVLHTDVDATELAAVLDARPYLTQIALLRQPWWPNEVQHGGLIEALEAGGGQDFVERTDGTHHWVEHRATFTGNPCVIPRRTFERDWPEGDWSESRFGRELFRDLEARGAYWGRRSDPPRVEHIGHQRVGSNY